MANRSYLIAVTKPIVFPTLRDVKDYQIIAAKNWGIPLLWLALFDSEDFEYWKPPGVTQQPPELRAPVAQRKSIPGRLALAADRLEQVAPKVKTWRSHLNLLQQAI